MKKFIAIRLLLALPALGLLLPGCASPNVNPAQPRANTGYVDFHADSAELYWQVSRFDDRKQDYQRIYSELKPPAGGVLRLAFAPGRYRLRVTFLNRVVRLPAVIEVEVRDGMITPVAVSLIPEGSTQVERKEERLGPTAKGVYGRSTKFRSDVSTFYRVTAEAGAPTPYQVKEQTVYAH